MKKISVIIAVAAISTVFAVIGCQKQEAPKSTVSTAVTSTVTSTVVTTTVPAAK